MARIWKRLSDVSDGDQHMVNILYAAYEHGLDIVEEACAESLASGLRSSEAVLNIVSRRTAPPPPEAIEPPAQLRPTVKPVADCARYDQLRGVATFLPSGKMQRHEVIEMARELKLPGIVRCFDEVIRSATQHQWRPQEVVAELLKAEMAEKTARSIRYQMNAAKFPVAKSLAEFTFTASTDNEEIVRTLHDGDFIEQARNAVFVGGTGTGKTHLVSAIC